MADPGLPSAASVLPPLAPPDYGAGGFLGLVTGLEAALGGPSRHASVAGPVPPEVAQARHVVLLLVDGLGAHWLARHGRGSTIAGGLATVLDAVFPSTTAAAIPALLTGLAPAAHGLTGWHVYFEEIDRILAVLPMHSRGPALPGQADQPEQWTQRLIPRHPLSARIGRPVWMLTPDYITGSPFNRHHMGRARCVPYRGTVDLFDTLAAIVRGAAEPSFIYAYKADFDGISHEHGAHSPQAIDAFARTDAALRRFLAVVRGTGTVVLVSADHGFIDAPPERTIDLADHPSLAAMLARPLCGERRVAYCYLRPGGEAAFDDAAQRILSHAAWICRPQDLIDAGWLGPGTPHPRLARRMGDRVLVMKDDWTVVDWLPGEERHVQRGVHAGVSADERRIPLAWLWS